MTDLTPEQGKALEIAHSLVDMGAAIFSAHRNSAVPLTARMPFMLPSGWQQTKAGTGHGYIDRWRPGQALCMVTGTAFDVIDVDVQNGGSIDAMAAELGGTLPAFYGAASTPSGGDHYLIAPTGLAKGVPVPGVDLQAGEPNGKGRGFVFLAPTVRVSKTTGQERAYAWTSDPLPTPASDLISDPGHAALIALINDKRTARPILNTNPPVAPVGDEDDLFGTAVDTWTPKSADRAIQNQLQAVRSAKAGTVNGTLGGAARLLGRFVAGGFLAEEEAYGLLETYLAQGGVHSDSWNAANGLDWTARDVIARGLANGSAEPYVVRAPVNTPAAPTEQPGAAPEPLPGGQAPPLLVESAAVMAYWLQNELGRGRLSGFFLRGGQVVHTPRVGEEGYVPPRSAGDDNGPAEIRAVSDGQLAAKIQYAYRCEKDEDVKGPDGKKTGEKRRVPALFPKIAASTAIGAPESMVGLRTLKGITLTPMMRADGSVLDVPGYDAASGYLYLPGPGVNVEAVPDAPTEGQVFAARRLLEGMVADFPFAAAEDRANYLGMLITPLIRELAPPSYKLFGIGAHQPGSGKSLLAQIAATIHGGVLRSEVPQDEAEWGKQTASVLSTTSAPVIVLDNVSGVLKSSVLAGLLTSSGEMSQRELGKSGELTFRNDRVWCVTGNNLSLGGDLVRRTILIMIDPDMANPETRTDFAINDLSRWVEEHRNEVLWSLLVLVRAWVVAGRPCPERKQSDSFAAWERTVAGILDNAGVVGEFDQESGKRAAGGGGDDGLATLLETLHDRFAGKEWTVAEALAVQMGDGLFGSESRDWLPSPVLDKLARSEASGRASFGKWLRFRLGRWVTGSNGCAYVLRLGVAQKNTARWMVERR